MIKTKKDILKNISSYNSDLVESVHDAFFQHMDKCIRNPESLIFLIPSIGSFYYRDKKSREFYYKIRNTDPDTAEVIKSYLDIYEDYYKDKLEFKYEKFGKESHDAYLMAKKQKAIQKAQENKSK